MRTFSGDPEDLRDRIAYELDALNYFRSSFLGKEEGEGGSLELNLDDIYGDSDAPKNLKISIVDNVSLGSPKEALGYFRPLAFSAAFKMQDMIAEWILRENNETGWRFQEKKKAYNRLAEDPQFSRPDFFLANCKVEKAFWEIYKKFIEFRGTVTHSGGTQIFEDGTVSITSRRGQVLNLKEYELASYLTAICLIVDLLVKNKNTSKYYNKLIEFELFELYKYHLVQGFHQEKPRIENVILNVGANNVKRYSPLSVEIPFPLLKSELQKVCPTECGDSLFYSAEIVLIQDQKKSTWKLPIEAVPYETITLAEGDTYFDKYLTHEKV